MRAVNLWRTDKTRTIGQRNFFFPLMKDQSKSREVANSHLSNTRQM